MNQPVITKQTIAVITAISTIVLAVTLIVQTLDSRTKVVFCNVGQGNAAYIRLSDTDILVDTGPGNRVLDCLGAHMPFFDRTIEYLVISHPQADHDSGTGELLKRYTVRNVIVAAAFRADPDIIRFRKTPKPVRFIFVTRDSTILLSGGASVRFFCTADTPAFPLSDNDKSLVVSITTIGNTYLFTGDASATVLSRLTHTQFNNKLILGVPHHGSSTGLSEYFIKTIRPVMAVISVGRNSYGHPAPKTIDLLRRYGIPYKRTDREGDIVFREG